MRFICSHAQHTSPFWAAWALKGGAHVHNTQHTRTHTHTHSTHTHEHAHTRMHNTHMHPSSFAYLSFMGSSYTKMWTTVWMSGLLLLVLTVKTPFVCCGMLSKSDKPYIIHLLLLLFDSMRLHMTNLETWILPDLDGHHEITFSQLNMFALQDY